METLGSNCSPRRHSGAQVRELFGFVKEKLLTLKLPTDVQRLQNGLRSIDFRAVGERDRLHPGRAEDFPNELAGECIIVNDKNLCRHVMVPRVARRFPCCRE